MTPLDTPSAGASPFHAGERDAQARMGVGDIAWASRAIRPYLPDQHRAFFQALPFLAAAARDALGRPWATLLAGDPGFVASNDPTSLEVRAHPGLGDPLVDVFTVGADIGLLGLDFGTRRRNRANGRIVHADPSGFRFEVRQSFGNCPQHIRLRQWRRRAGGRAGPTSHGAALSPRQQARIAAADTFFIASGHAGAGDLPSDGLDVSHRGGATGFVEVRGDRLVAFPDLGGNKFYNTVGNLLVDPRIGLLFLDFASGGLLQIAGRARIDWDSPVLAEVPAAERLIAIEIEAVVESPGRLPLRFEDV